MKVDIIRKVFETIELDDRTALEVTRKTLLRMVEPGEYLRTDANGVIFLMQDDPDWRHGSLSEEIVRRATSLDKLVFEMLDNLPRDFK